jgi:hypothetical protein
MSYLNFISTQGKLGQFRTVSASVYDSSIQNSEYLNDFSLNSINKIIIDLNNVINSPNGALLWGHEQMSIDSNPLLSKCFDETRNKSLPDVPTQNLLNLMIQIKKFKTQYHQNSENLKNIIKQAFSSIKSNPNNYKKYPNSDIRFAITIDNIYLTLVLEPNDLNLTDDDFLSQLDIDSDF